VPPWPARRSARPVAGERPAPPTGRYASTACLAGTSPAPPVQPTAPACQQRRQRRASAPRAHHDNVEFTTHWVLPYLMRTAATTPFSTLAGWMGPAAKASGRGEHFAPPGAPVTAVLQDILSRPVDMAAGRQTADAVTHRAGTSSRATCQQGVSGRRRNESRCVRIPAANAPDPPYLHACRLGPAKTFVLQNCAFCASAGRALSQPGVVGAVDQHLSGCGAAHERARSMCLS
jgi:hypothetical protein